MVTCIRNWTLHHTSHSLITQKSDIFKAINNSSTTTLFFSSTVCQAYPYIPILDTKLKAYVWENRQIFKPLFLATDIISFMPTVSSGIFSWRALPVLPGMLFLLRKIILKQTLFFPRLKSNLVLVIWQVNANFSCMWLFTLLWHSAFNRPRSPGHSAADSTPMAQLSLPASATYLEDTHFKLVGFLPHFIFDIEQQYCGVKATPKQWKNMSLYASQFSISFLFNWWFKQWQKQLLRQLTSINGNFPQAVIWHFRSTAFVTVEPTVC